FDQLIIKRMFEAMILLLSMTARYILGQSWLVEYLAEIESLCFPVFDAGLHIQKIGTADEVIELPDAKLSHQFAYLFGNEEEVIDHMFRLACKALAQVRILSGDTYRASV